MLKRLMIGLSFFLVQSVIAKDTLSPLAEANNQFAIQFFQEAKNHRENLFFSPFNISTAFLMLASGAKNETEGEILNTLHYTPELLSHFSELNDFLVGVKKTNSSAPILLTANAAWVQKGISLSENYEKNLSQNFQSLITNVDFFKEKDKSIAQIDQWIAVHTNNKIRRLLSSQDIDEETKLILTGVIYLKAQWMHPFEKNGVAELPFHITTEISKDVPMMSITKHYPLFVNEEVSILELPYSYSSESPQLSMIIVLPHSQENLQNIETKLSYSQFNTWINNMKSTHVKVTLPKFKIETRLDLITTLEKLGMRLPFHGNADFSGITKSEKLFVSKAVHQTFINVDENGTEAAAATGISMKPTSMLDPSQLYSFTADHPFLFFIRDKITGAILFIGRLQQP